MKKRKQIRRVKVLLASLILFATFTSFAKDTAKVRIKIPVPPKISTVGFKNILVTRVIANTNVDFDIAQEANRIIKSQLRKASGFTILDVPPPNLPEQTIEELKNNYEFWKHLGEKYDADLIILGAIDFNATDVSGFVSEDVMNPYTGHKVRRTVYAEREEFTIKISFLFFKGLNGAFLYEDHFQDKSVYEGLANDALQVLYNFSDWIHHEIKKIITPHTRDEERYIFLH
jgi:hypothetical protein